MKNKQNRKRFTRQFFRGNGWNMAVALLQAVMIVGANLLLSWLMQQLIDVSTGVSTAFTLGQLVIIGGICVAIVAAGCGLAYISKPRFLFKAMTQYKNYVFSELSKKNISAFNDENTSLYISALSNDSNSIETDYLKNIFNLIDNGLFFLGGLVMMFYYSPALTLISIALAFLPVLSSILTGNRLATAEATVSKKNESFMSMLKDSLGGFSVIKSFQAEAAICRLFAQNVKAVEDAKRHKLKISVIIQMFSSIAGIIAQFGVFMVGAYMAVSGKGISGGVVIVFVQLMNYVLSPIRDVPQILASRKAANSLIDKLADALSSNVRDEGTPISKELTDGITIKDLSFGYDSQKEVLHSISTKFEAGKSYAIVGASGSGKSTLLNLLMAGYHSYSGSICYDGKELRDIGSASLYELISIIQQNVFVFNSSIRDNVTMFHEFEESAINRAMELSGLSELIQRRGADEPCGENGCNLSGGEKQRISIARSLLRKTTVLLMDEATASLDAKTAYRVISSILDLHGLTRIVVTHSLDEAVLKRYDKILTMKAGQIVESGTYDELIEKKGYFYSLYTVSQ